MRMTKKVLAFVLAVVVFATVLPVGGSKVKAAEDVAVQPSENDFSYSEREEGLYITGYKGQDETIVIPSQINGKRVVGISNLASYTAEIKSITIPYSVIDINVYVFAVVGFGDLVSLNEIVVEEKNPNYSSEDGILYNKGCTELIACPATKAEVVIPDGVTHIGSVAFRNHSSLRSITMPDSLSSIGNYAFCNCSNLTDIRIPDGVTYVGGYAFYNCSSLTNISISNRVTDIKENTFSDCTSLTSVIIPNGVTTIGGYAFYGCNSLTSIRIPDSVISIRENAFNYCSNLNEIVVEKNNANYSSKDGILYNKEQTELISCRGNRESVTIPESVKKIGEEAFYGCNSLRSISIPDSVLEIMQNAFEGTAYFTDETNWEEHALYIGNHLITVEDGISNDYIVKEGTRTIASGAFRYRNITNVTIPDSVTTIAYQAFEGCGSLTKVTVPKSVVKIDRAFEDCSNLSSIDVEDGNSHYSSEDGILYNKERTELVAFPGGRTSVIIPDGVLKIGECAFNWCDRLADITIPSSVTCIGDYAFYWCGNLKNITIPDRVTYIGEGAFHDCGLKNIILPYGVTRIEKSTFNYCWELENVIIPNSVTYIGYSAFYGCNNLQKLHYNGTPEQWAQVEIKIDDNSYIPEEIVFSPASEDPKDTCDFTYLEKNDGLYITGYTGQDTVITIPNQIEGKKVVGIADKAFAGYSTLENVTLPDTLFSIGVRAFEGCNRLKSIIISDSVTQIRQSAFIGCSDLTSITIPDGVLQIGGEAFSDTGYWDDDANWEDGALYIGTHLIETNPEIAPDYVVKEGTTTISLCDFQYITSLTIPDSVKYLGCEDPDRYLVMEEDRLSKVTVYYKGTQEQWNQIVIDESQGAPKEVVYTKASISYGDATGDQIIDMKDVVLLRKYMAEFDYDSNTSTVAVAAGGDANGDGVFDMKDVVLLRKYIADFDYDTGSSGVVLGP